MDVITVVLFAALSEEQFMALITDAQFAADSLKIDWKATFKIACFLEVLVLKSADACSMTSSMFQTSTAIVFSFFAASCTCLAVPKSSGEVGLATRSWWC